MNGRDRTKPIWKTRRVLMPIGILLAAAIIGLLATHQTRQRLGTVESHVRELCRLAANGDDLTGSVLVNDGSIESATIAAIERGCAGALPDLSNVEIEVAPGDMETVSSHRGQWTEATHHATIAIDGVSTLALRVQISQATMDRVVIIGYWLPEAVAEAE